MGAGRTLCLWCGRWSPRGAGVLRRPLVPCTSRAPHELQALGPLYPDSRGFGAASCLPPTPYFLSLMTLVGDPTPSFRNCSHPYVPLCSQLCPVVLRTHNLCIMKCGAECGRLVFTNLPGSGLWEGEALASLWKCLLWAQIADRSLAGLL